METANINFWCHQCQEEIRPMYVPTPTCPYCHGDFVEMIEEENDPRGFITEGVQPNEESEGQNNTLPALILSILQSVHRQEGSNVNENGMIDLTSSEAGNQDSSAPSSPGSFNVNDSSEEQNTRAAPRANPPSLRNLLLEVFSSQFPSSQTSQTDNRVNETEADSTTESVNDLDRIDGLHNTTQSQPYTPRTQTESLASDSDTGNTRQGFFRQMFTALSTNDWETGGSSPFTVISRDGRYSLTANFGGADDATNSRIAPFLQLLTGMTGNPGDYALGPNALDNIITQLMEQTNSSNAAPPAPKETIDNLPVEKVAQVDVDSREECPVCKDEFVIEEEVRLLPCKHRYHTDCIVPWLTKNGTCPVCRFSLAEPESKEGNPPGGEEECTETIPDDSSVISLD